MHYLLLYISILFSSSGEAPLYSGTLFAVGGESDPELYDYFIELAGGPEASVIWIPTAMEDRPYDREDFIKQFEESARRLGFKNVTVLHTTNRDIANTEEFVKPIKEAKAVWFSGGRQWRLADSYLNTLTHKELNNLLKRGGVIGGNSAGATIQGSYLTRGDSKTNTIMMGDHEEGLGFLQNVAIDQHVIARNRELDLIEIVTAKPQILGIGIDERTAIVVRGDEFEVIGKSSVLIYDANRWKSNDSDLKYISLKRGNRFNLRTREIIE